MKILYKLAVSQLKKNKSQTFITLIGIVLSITLITSIMIFFNSFYVTLVNQAIAQSGKWHYAYDEIEVSKKAQLDALPYVKETYPLVYLQDGKAKGMETPDYYVHFQGTDEVGFRNLPIIISDGSIPSNENEILIDDTLVNLYPNVFAVGKTVMIQLGKYNYASNSFSPTKSKSFRISGTYDDGPNGQRVYNVYTFTNLRKLDPNTKISLFVIETKISSSMINRARYLQIISSDGSIISPSFNDYYLGLNGVSLDGNNIVGMLIIYAIVLLVIVVAGSIALIYNGFSITATDMQRQIGLLGSIGATKSQKRIVILIQSILLSMIGITFGLILGLIVMHSLIAFLNHQIPEVVGGTKGIQFATNVWVYIAIIFVSFLTVVLSALIPAHNVAKSSPIESIRQNLQINVPKNVKKLPRFLKPLGLEAQLSYQQMKRFTKRYRAPRFSIILSIVLFLSVVGYSLLAAKANTSYINLNNYDLSISNNESTGYDLIFYHKIAQLKSVNTYTIQKRGIVGLKNVKFTESFTKLFPYLNLNQRQIDIIMLDAESMKNYLKEINFSESDIKTNGLSGILINSGSVYLYDQKLFVKTEFLEIKKGDEITLSVEQLEENSPNATIPSITEVKLKIIGITDRYPIGPNTSRDGIPTLIMENTTEAWHTLFSNLESNSTMFVTCVDPILCGNEIQAIYDKIPAGSLSIYNQKAMNSQQERSLQTLYLFFYAFIGIVALISIANILNSISVSILSRRRELAMLKSVGMTNRSISKMLSYESLFYTTSAIMVSFPIAFGIQYLIHFIINRNRYVEIGFDFPYLPTVFVIITVFAIVRLAMIFAIKKLAREEIIDQLKDETV
jgi:putative ABC transport system permease protein